MKRAFAVSGFTMLGTLAVFCNIHNDYTMSVAIIVSLVVLLFSLLIKPTRKNRTIPVAALSAFVALLILFTNNASYFKTAVLYSNREITVSGSLSQLPYKNNGNTYYILSTDTIDGFEEDLKVRIACNSPVDIEPGDTVTVKMKAFLLGQSDDAFLNYYKSKNLLLSGYATSDFSISKGTHNNINDKVLKLRYEMTNSVMTFLPNDNGAVIAGLVLGEKSDISKYAQNCFAACGVSHLFVVSGLHMSSWSMLFFLFLRKLRLSGKTASALSIVFCLFFILLTGCNPPVVRAGFMMIVIYLAEMFSREAEPFNSIGLSLCLMLCTNPYLAMNLSLWLSLLATLGILILMKPISVFLKKPFVKVKAKFPRTLIDTVISAISISVAVSVFTMPVYVLKLKTISSLVILSNLLMVSVGSFCMSIGGIATVLMTAGVEFIGKPLLIASGLIAKFLLWVSSSLSQFRYALIPVYSTYSKILLAVIAVVVAIMLIINLKDRRIIKSVSVFMAALFVIVNLSVYTINFNLLKITVCNVGNGTAVTVLYKGKSVLLGCGGNDYADSTICAIMKSGGIANIDYLVLPDSSKYNSSAAYDILNGYTVGNLMIADENQLNRFSFGSNVTVIDKSIISLDEVTIAIDRNYAQIVFGNFKAIISFSQNNTLTGADGTLLVCRNAIPDGTSEQNFKRVIVNTENPENIWQGEISDNISTTFDNGSISLLVGKNGYYNEWREA